jgi:hypothetical protein
MSNFAFQRNAGAPLPAILAGGMFSVALSLAFWIKAGWISQPSCPLQFGLSSRKLSLRAAFQRRGKYKLLLGV